VTIESDYKGCQLPIQLGWATTIQKAAGITFDNVAINFGIDWHESEANLIQCVMRPLRTSQAYAAITRSRNLAYFDEAQLFTDSVIIALLDNQNHSSLEFLKNLRESQDHSVRILQNLQDLSTEDTLFVG
jgi:ATP-dependent exoDNAse (exonuclease V) alpha subunit